LGSVLGAQNIFKNVPLEPPEMSHPPA
jgi:hypothetical protein